METKKFEVLRQYVLVRYSKKSGKIDTTLEGMGHAMLKMWGLQNCTKTKEVMVFDKETGDVVAIFEGTGSFPVVHDGRKEDLGNVEKYCPGLLKEVQ